MGHRDSMTFLRFATDAAYQQLRSALNFALGYPTPDGVTLEAILPVERALRDTQGRAVLMLNRSLYARAVAAGVLPWQLGGVAEISEDEYRAETAKHIDFQLP